MKRLGKGQQKYSSCNSSLLTAIFRNRFMRKKEHPRKSRAGLTTTKIISEMLGVNNEIPFEIRHFSKQI